MVSIKTSNILWMTLVCCLHVLDSLAEEIGTCTSVGSVGKSPSIHYCDETPSYKLSTTDPAVPHWGATFTSNTYNLGIISPTLTLTLVANCPQQLTGNVGCNEVKVTLGSGPNNEDGTPISIEGTGADGIVEWTCRDSTTPPNEIHYHFPIKFDADIPEAPAPETAGFANVANNGATPSTPSGILPIKFQKFESVDDKTKIYYMKTPSASHMIFMSNETMITLADGDYSSMIDEAGRLSAVAPKEVCAEAVELRFKKREDGASELNMGTFLIILPFLFSLFN